ncbi:Hsp20/alpha crystallin family protein [Halanaerobium congolense]|jgi:HSP20 family protein|uniref:HSP20 family protein n=1 Tax=Halanaerobium congolense TaxID=54121 RepID=A0A1G6JKP2_9FIRM|nr:Hsp20/alpha crystallin family protein [Halanaerobium congolense]OEG61979.1 MAG: heat-shock protein [Halanaerobium sp. MDAL1]PUU93454.1 MAG: HSP20 family protein [Halanaerobium sp.]PTX16202.1 HSP20 family protein [Halanaerobium congolense]PXV60218.1 HSP20 family protein [Halanaerobium congolense]TDP25895.1 HSP20 family protein [Halanaerobium congolense]
MFDLVPFRNRSRRDVAEREEDPFNSLVSGFFGDVMDFAGRSFRVDIKESDDEYTIEAEMPGMKREDIKLELNDDYLTISAEHQEEKEEKKENYIRRERRQGKYTRSFYLENVDQDEIKAEYDEGILKVHLPKLEQTPVKKRTIDIE